MRTHAPHSACGPRSGQAAPSAAKRYEEHESPICARMALPQPLAAAHTTRSSRREPGETTNQVVLPAELDAPGKSPDSKKSRSNNSCTGQSCSGVPSNNR